MLIDVRTAQREAQEASHRIATGWFRDCDVECGGVSLGDVMEYDVLRVVGALLLDKVRKEAEGDGRGRDGEST